MKNVLYVSAGAGSGKTFYLTNLLSEKLKGTINPSEVILTTFTELAAAEFKEKAREALLNANPPDKAIELESGAIGTVHSIALGFVRKYWYLLGISPQVNIMSDADKNFYINQSLASMVTDEDLASFNNYCKTFDLKDDDNKPDLDFWVGYLEEMVNTIDNYNVTDDNLDKSKCESIAVANRIFDNLAKPDKTKIEAIVKEIKGVCNASTAAGAKTLLETLNMISNYTSYATVIKLLGINVPGGKKGIETVNNNLGYDYIQLLQKYQESTYYCGIICDCINRIFEIAKKWKSDFKKYKQQNAIIDYNDMEQLFLKLLNDATFRKEIEDRYKVVMVDEFQDSNPTQLRIFNELSELVKESIWVGDPKQAIYGFRGADTDLVQSVAKKIYADIDKTLTHKELKESWRSRPELVNLATNIFLRSFEGILPPEQIKLKPHWPENTELSYPLLHWHSGKNKELSCKQIANGVKNLIDAKINVGVKNKNPEVRTIEPKDIAILARTNEDCKGFINALRELEIPVSSPESDILQRTEIQLVCSILNYVIYSRNRFTLADLRRLYNNDSVEDIISDNLRSKKEDVSAEDKKKEDELKLHDELELPEWLKPVADVAERVKDQPISEMVASIIAELNLVDFVRRWGEENTRVQNLYTLQNLAKQYDEHCLQMCLGASVGGFLQYLKIINYEVGVDNQSNTVKVLTYHKSKGLEWPVVILTGLDKNELDEQGLFKRRFMSVMAYPSDFDNEEQSWLRDYLIHFFPRINSTRKNNIGSTIAEKIKNEPIYKYIVNRVSGEERRLLYVGVTRARDYLVSTSYSFREKLVPLQWLVNTGISNDGKIDINESDVDVWKDSSVPQSVILTDPIITTGTPMYTPKLFEEHKQNNYPRKILSPSNLSIDCANAKPEIIFKTNERIKLDGVKEDDFASIGTCIHNALASFTIGHTENNQKKSEKTVSNFAYAQQIPSPNQIADAFDKLIDFITKEYGAITHFRQELPFYQKLENGQIVNGEMDLVCETEKGIVLVDYKSFPGKEEDFMKEGGEHYVGNYAPQLAAYQNALSKDGKTVIAALIYYVVQGCVVKLF
ncbi:MAG: UvrD-helicase domain-containing protein [Bacteroidales bacterium]|nr:UvrD-helicase domain-containing protein [Bacteroidales bacterium]